MLELPANFDPFPSIKADARMIYRPGEELPAGSRPGVALEMEVQVRGHPPTTLRPGESVTLGGITFRNGPRPV